MNTEEAPFNATSGDDITESLSVTNDLIQIRDRVLIQGGEIKTEERRHAGDRGITELDTIYKFSNLATVTVDGVAQTVGTDYLDEEADFDCLWNFNQKYVRFPDTGIPGSTVTTNISINRTGRYVKNLLLYSTWTDCRHEHVELGWKYFWRCKGCGALRGD